VRDAEASGDRVAAIVGHVRSENESMTGLGEVACLHSSATRPALHLSSK